MVDRIELTRVTAHGCTVETACATRLLRFTSNRTAPLRLTIFRNPDTLSSYVTFLRINAVVYWLQRHGYLLLRGANTFVPYDSNSGLDDSGANSPKAQDVVTALPEERCVGDMVGTKWAFRGESVYPDVFPLPAQSEGAKPVPDIAKIKREILNDPEMKELREGPALDAIL